MERHAQNLSQVTQVGMLPRARRPFLNILGGSNKNSIAILLLERFRLSVRVKSNKPTRIMEHI
jgi:hypothetical protein